MRRLLYVMLIAGPLFGYGQITTPQIKARFGVDADLRANFFNGLSQAGNDDWFNLLSADTSGKSVIDTTGAAAIVAGYLADVSPFPKRMASMYRTMNRPSFSIVNNRLWLDALWVRDYHGNDTTVYTSGADKNGMSPAFWSGGIQGIPDKNDILDIYVHVRRAGPTNTDSLWMFGGLSLDNITGNRYFDFEMYQTDIYYDRVSHKWYGYGPDAGHTSWQFDAAGNITKPGDIIFSAEYQSSTLTNIEARVWVQKSVWQTVTPTAFSWSGQFDGDGAAATYGYASIQPKSSGAYYTGLGSANNVWPGPFRLILQNNTVTNAYAKDQFMEFSVNLSKLGLDPVTQTGGDICGTPFNRIVIKTRASAAFTAELKDFVAPTDFFLAPRVLVATNTPMICDTGSVANIYVTNPSPTSLYLWSTTNGRIVGPTTGTSIAVDTPGVYIVRQFLQAGCSVYATDTIQIFRIPNCVLLHTRISDLTSRKENDNIILEWKVFDNAGIRSMEVERSLDGIHFTLAGAVASLDPPGIANYSFTDDGSQIINDVIYYRIRLVNQNGQESYSSVLRVLMRNNNSLLVIFPSPTKGPIQIEINDPFIGPISVQFYNSSGKLVGQFSRIADHGFRSIQLDNLVDQPAGIYFVKVQTAGISATRKIILIR